MEGPITMEPGSRLGCVTYNAVGTVVIIDRLTSTREDEAN